MEGDVSLKTGGGCQALSQKEGVMIEAPGASAESQVCQGLRPQTLQAKDTHSSTSWPRGPRSTRFTARTLGAFGTSSTGGASFTLERGREGCGEAGQWDTDPVGNSSGQAVHIPKRVPMQATWLGPLT